MRNVDRKPPDEFSIEQQELLNRLSWSTWLRICIITILVGGAALTYQHKIIFHIAPWLSPLIILVITLYLVSFAELVLLRKQKKLRSIAYISTSWDAVFVSALVIATGGIDSIYTFLYLFVAIEGGFLLAKKGGLLFASVSAILYGLLVDIQFYRLAPNFIPPSDTAHLVRDVFLNLITYISTTFIVGILSAFLGGNLLKAKRALSISSIDLKQLANLHSIIINSIESGLITLDEHHTINTVNPAATRITGYTLDEVIGKNINDIMSGIQFNASPLKRNEMTIRKKDNSIIQTGYNISNLHDDTGRGMGAVITFQDLTEMKKMEAKLKRADILATAGRLAASVAHEVRNPLASISGAVQLLIEDLKGNSEFDKLLELIFREVDRIDNLVTEFLYMSRPVTNIQDGVIVRQLIDEVFENISRRDDYSPLITLQTSVENSIAIRADKLKLKQVLLNLVLNAIHAIRDKGSIDIDCIVKNNDAILSVKDTGEGMEENEIRLSLEPFWTKNPGGTGLGLPVVQSIVEQHNGTLNIQSAKNRGTVVTITLPL
jgi:two-component system sensor histidine kinase PilS (NtrC family)